MITLGSMITLELPLPPSSNHQYLIAQRGSKRILVSSPDLKAFQKSVLYYRLQRPNDLKEFRNLMRHWKNLPLQISTHFYFERSKLYCKNGKMKRLDCSNRLKALHDCVADLLGMDDSQFFKITATKETTDGNEKTLVSISPICSTESLTASANS